MIFRLLPLLILLGCATARPSGLGPLVEVDNRVEVSWGGLLMAPAGRTYLYTQKPQVVLIRRDMAGEMRKNVVAHELFHTLGYVGHIRDGCFMSVSVPKALIERPCPEEVAATSLAVGVRHIFVLDPLLRDDVEWAAEMWNTCSNRILFVVH